jgi:predicted transcriptional regulator
MDAGELLDVSEASVSDYYIHTYEASREMQQVCTRQANKQRRYKSSTKMTFQFKRVEGETREIEQKVHPENISR